MKIFVEVKVSEKSGKIYACLMCDLGYRIANISFDSSLCAELCNLTLRDLLSEPKIIILFEN